MKLSISIFMFTAMFFLPVAQASSMSETLSMQQVLQKVINHYPSIKTAALQLEKAKQENIKVESQLSWLLKGNAAYTRDTSLFGTATDRYNLAGSMNRGLENGGILGFNANVSREDAEDTFSPALPNPSTKTRVDINYRHRLAKGAGNPLYEEGLTLSEAGQKVASSEQLALYDRLADQVVELYLSAAITQARISSIDKTIERGQRLQKYIQQEFGLGLSEEKDVLQVDARLSINKADKQSLQVAWQKQLISLNRLMGRDWNAGLKPDARIIAQQTESVDDIFRQVQTHSPELKRIDAQLEIAESAIRSQRDKRKDELDLVVFLGNEINQGESSIGDQDESELIGGISLEFNRGLDKSGLDAELRQAHFDRGVALQDKKQVLEDLQYSVSSLLAEIRMSESALKAFSVSVKAEQKKLDEALKRYRDGRIETDRIIEFESQLAVAELSHDLQSIELTRRYHQLDLIRGQIWKSITFPDYRFDDYISSKNDREYN